MKRLLALKVKALLIAPRTKIKNPVKFLGTLAMIKLTVGRKRKKKRKKVKMCILRTDKLIEWKVWDFFTKSLYKAGVHTSFSEATGGQQMLMPVINVVTSDDGNKQPVLTKTTENIKSIGSMDLDFLLSENSSSAPAAGTSKYSDLHHHALSLDDLKDQNDENESDIPMSE